jgi:hypothetical protein
MMMFVFFLIAVVVIALIARAGSKAPTGAPGDRAWLAGGEEAARPTPEPRSQAASDLAPADVSQPIGEAAEGLQSEDADETEGEYTPTPTTIDGWKFIVREDGVETVRTAFFNRGQFVAARVRHVPDSDHWGLEVLERESIEADGGTCWPLGGWEFKNEGEALAALSLMERCVIRPPRDEHGEPRTYSEEDFERSRRFMEQPLPDSGPAGEDVPPS